MPAENNTPKDPGTLASSPIQAESATTNDTSAAPPPPQPQQPWQQPMPMIPPPKPNVVLRIISRLVLFGFLGAMLLMMILFVVGFAGLLSGSAGGGSSANLQEKHVSHKRHADNKIAIITIDGTITSGEGYVKDQIDRVKKDDAVKGVVLRINSPGGTITGSDYILHHLKQLKQFKEQEWLEDDGNTATATVTVKVGAVVDAAKAGKEEKTEEVAKGTPKAADDVIETEKDEVVTTDNLLANDSDPDGDTLTISSFTDPKNGTLVYNNDGTFTYTPDADFQGTDTFTYTVSDARKKDFHIVVSMGALAASGGYYVAMAVEDTPKSIYAEPTTWTGSIGVIIPHYSLKGLMENWGIEEDPITSGEMKGMGSIARPIQGEELVIFQQLVNVAFTRFKDIIKEGRPEFAADPAKLDALATGQIYTAGQALDSGLVDEIGFIEKAIHRSIVLAGLDEDKVAVIRYEPEPTLSGILFGESQTKQAAKLDQVSQLLDLSVPRGYYLCTMLPAAVETAEK